MTVSEFTSMDALSLYDPHRFDAESPANVRGGRARAKGMRDRWGRLLPRWGTLPEPVAHGRAGGLKRHATGKRVKGKFVKEQR